MPQQTGSMKEQGVNYGRTKKEKESYFWRHYENSSDADRIGGISVFRLYTLWLL